MHVTLRVVRDAPGLRRARVFRVFRVICRAFVALRARSDFRLVHYSVQGIHVHLIVEADDRVALTRGMQALTIRIALAINRVRAGKGRVFADRYHSRPLKTPLEVRRALLYVLRNDRKHGAAHGWRLPPWRFDPCSSAFAFDGWEDATLLDIARRAHSPPEAQCTAPSRSFLLRRGWRRHGLLGLAETPRS